MPSYRERRYAGEFESTPRKKKAAAEPQPEPAAEAEAEPEAAPSKKAASK